MAVQRVGEDQTAARDLEAAAAQGRTDSGAAAQGRMKLAAAQGRTKLAAATQDLVSFSLPSTRPKDPNRSSRRPNRD
jgi:hypothetical protein